MTVAETISISLGVSLAGILSLSYWIYWGGIKKKWTAVWNKRIWLLTGVLVAASIFWIAPGVLPKIAVFLVIMLLPVLAGHVPPPKFVPDDRKPVFEGNSVIQKIYIFFWC